MRPGVGETGLDGLQHSLYVGKSLFLGLLLVKELLNLSLLQVVNALVYYLLPNSENKVRNLFTLASIIN